MSRKPYRPRSWLRRHLPGAISANISKGCDCGEGNHEWYLAEEGTWACYHCEQETRENPYPPLTWARHRGAALLMVAAETLESGYDDEEAIEFARSSMLEAEALFTAGAAPDGEDRERGTPASIREAAAARSTAWTTTAPRTP